MYRKLTFLLLYIAGLSVVVSAQVPDYHNDRISLLFIGDIMGHDDQIKSAWIAGTGTYDYDTVFSFISPVISEADLAFANFEVTLAGPPYMGYPRFSSPADLASACKKAGIDCMVTANNHSADRGNQGIISTLERLDSIGIPHTGTFRDQASRDSLYPLIVSSNGISVALLNYTYGTNGIEVPGPVIVNMLDRDQISEDIETARAAGPDIIILFLHWGTEYDTIPSKEQTDLAEYLFSKGADLIIGSHPHVLQKMIWTKNDTLNDNKIAVYSLGNFITNQRRPKTDGGAMVRISLERKNGSFEVTEAGYYLTWVYIPVVNNRKKYLILPCSEYEQKPDFFGDLSDFKQMKKFIDDSRLLLDNQNINIREYIFSDNKWTIDLRRPPSPGDF